MRPAVSGHFLDFCKNIVARADVSHVSWIMLYA